MTGARNGSVTGAAPSQERLPVAGAALSQAPLQEQLHGADLNVSASAVARPTTP